MPVGLEWWNLTSICERTTTQGIEGRCREIAERKEMSTTSHRICLDPGCIIQPSFGMIWGQPLYCKAHKDASHVDVVSRRCMQHGCDTQANFGSIRGYPLYCKI